jgi:hypothetical protein
MLTSDCSMRLDRSAMALDARRVCGYIIRYDASESSSVPCDDEDMYIADLDGGSLPPFFMASFAFRFHLVACRVQSIPQISQRGGGKPSDSKPAYRFPKLIRFLVKLLVRFLQLVLCPLQCHFL